LKCANGGERNGKPGVDRAQPEKRQEDQQREPEPGGEHGERLAQASEILTLQPCNGAVGVGGNRGQPACRLARDGDRGLGRLQRGDGPLEGVQRIVVLAISPESAGELGDADVLDARAAQIVAGADGAVDEIGGVGVPAGADVGVVGGSQDFGRGGGTLGVAARDVSRLAVPKSSLGPRAAAPR